MHFMGEMLFLVHLPPQLPNFFVAEHFDTQLSGDTATLTYTVQASVG